MVSVSDSDEARGNGFGPGGNDAQDIEKGDVVPHAPVHPQKKHIFHPSLKGNHVKVWLGTGINLIVMSSFILAILSIYWGSMYNRDSRYHHLNIWVINWDQENGLVGDSLVELTQALTGPDNHLSYEIQTRFSSGDYEQIFDELVDEKAWGAFIIAPNASQALSSAVSSRDSSYKGGDLIQFAYVQGRSETTYASVVLPQIDSLSVGFVSNFTTEFTANMSRTLSPSNFTELASSAPKVISTPVDITYNNLRPFTGNVTQAIDLIGLVFLIIVSFFQVSFFAPIHMILIPHVHFPQYMLYRWVLSFISFFFLSFFFSCVSLAFQVDFSAKFGDAGFVVYWMINWIGMAALGGASENIALIIFAVFPQAIGFWLILWVVINTSTTFYPLALSPGVFRVGYALPLLNVSTAIRTTLFDTRNILGRNFGILFAWVAVNFILNVPALGFVKWYKSRHPTPGGPGGPPGPPQGAPKPQSSPSDH